MRQTTSGGQRLLTITSTNGDKHAIAAFFVRLGRWLASFEAIAEQWGPSRRWAHLLTSIFAGAFGVMRRQTT